jgi:hypothetical protein
MAKKVGKLSLEDESFIINNVSSMSLEEIADCLNRNVEPIKKFIDKKRLIAELTPEEVEDRTRLLATLHSMPYWDSVVYAYTDKNEIKFFENMWIDQYSGFNEDLNRTEHVHLKQWIEVEILQTRAAKQQSEISSRIQQLEEIISEEKLRNPTNIIIQAYEGELGLMRGALAANIKNQIDLIDRSQKLSATLKSTRDKVRSVEYKSDDFWERVKQLDDEKRRKEASREAEILKLATMRAKKRLGELYEFSDGSLDRPLLNADTVILGNPKIESEDEDE